MSFEPGTITFEPVYGVTIALLGKFWQFLEESYSQDIPFIRPRMVTALIDEDNHLGLTPANGISPIFLLSPNVLRTVIIFYGPNTAFPMSMIGESHTFDCKSVKYGGVSIFFCPK